MTSLSGVAAPLRCASDSFNTVHTSSYWIKQCGKTHVHLETIKVKCSRRKEEEKSEGWKEGRKKEEEEVEGWKVLGAAIQMAVD